MTDAKYVLCRWERRLWPAKVLARTNTSTKNTRKKEFFLDVQILSLEEKIQVKSTEVEALKKSQIENIASFLASQDEVPAAPLEELTYRRSLRVALDVLNARDSIHQEGPSRRDGTAPSEREQLPTGAASLLPDSLSPPFFREEKLAQPEPERRWGHAQHSWSGLSAGEEAPTCKVDHNKELRKRENPGAPSVTPTRGGCQDGCGSRNHRSSGTRASKRRRNSASKSSWCQGVPALAGAGLEEEIQGEPGRWMALSSPSRAREDDPCARAEGHDPGLPSGSLTVPPAQDGAGGRLVKRLCLDGGRRLQMAQLEPAASGTVLPLSSSPAEEAGCPGLQAGGGRPEQEPPSSEESMECGSINSILDAEEEDEEPPRILLYHEPRSFEVGMLVWLKYQKYPFWPAVVKSVRRRDKKASVLFIEGDMNPKGRGITVSLRRLKHFDCKEKQMLLDKAKEDFDRDIGSCVSLITDYRVRLGCGSFAGSFLEYYAADISYPVRKSIQQDVLGTGFPQLSKGELTEPMEGIPVGRRRPCRKVLPDRSRAARDRANQKLVEYIVKTKGAESHLRAILKSRRPSRWLKTFLSSSQYVTCVETYLEDEEQLDLVVKYLQGVYQEMDSEVLARVSGDSIRFILDVLLPEAIICAISAVDAVDYKTAEEKYIKGPSLSYREKEIFDNQLLEERNRRR
ncbi:PWWP domain-containing DNA repair factor 3A isoform X1 [Sciurus carolinensis]|uniref:PWWP domain-containing DNA repair factor 3A isoform X1 n=1 Tax=Sciurus carolinensis TaxID=30640 RepID=UPI001FB3B818|nr:PWWP domain-containing DNA repair factor 3A isoform X1 [Sciurus carolinensis]XP_047388065.1 PWWP domain-containing DNA repair factor 3A isoform X1 [Sciurus carolinensis]